jgi:hypothetical protein
MVPGLCDLGNQGDSLASFPALGWRAFVPVLHIRGKGMSAWYQGRVWVFAFSSLLSCAVGAQEVRYTYDADGRLIAQGPAVDGLAITGFAPSYGSSGTSVSIQGHGFDAVAANNQVSFGGVTAVVASARPDLLTTTVPATAVTGPIAVVTSGKRAQSPIDFVILPSGADLNGIVGRAALPLDGTYHSYSSVAGRSYALTFPVTAESFISLDLNWAGCAGLSSQGLSYKLFGPNGDAVVNGALIETSPTLLLPKAASSGTYTLLVSAPQAWTCSLAAQVDSKVVAEDSPIHLVTSLPYHTKRILFDVEDGGAYGVGSSDLANTPAGGALVMGFNGPAGESAGSYACGYIGYGACQGQIIYRPAGTYSAVLQPYDTRTQMLDTKFWLTKYVDGGAFEPNSTVHVAVEKPGQVVRYTFHGHVGQLLRLAMTDRNMGAGAWYDSISGKTPAGDCILFNGYCGIDSSNPAADISPLPSDGVYTIFYYINSLGATAPTGSVTMTLSDTVHATIPSADNHVDVATTINGQQVQVPIEVKAGEDISIALSDVSTQPNPMYLSGEVHRPDGSLVNYIYCGAGYGGCFLTIQGGAPGIYSLILKLPDARAQTFRARVWRLPFVDAGTLDINSTVNVSAALPGQVLRYLVTGAQGESLHFWLDNVVPGTNGQAMNISGKNPAGDCFFDNNYGCNFGVSSYGLYNPPQLRLDGTYSLLVYFSGNGNQAAYGTGSITLSSTKTISMPPGDWSGVVTADLKGQSAQGVIHVAQGESFTLATTDVLPVNDDGLLINLYAPNGSLFRNFWCGYSGGCATSVLNAVAGDYIVEETSMNGYGNTFSATLWKSHVLDGGALLPNVPRTLSVDRAGNLVKLTVSGRAGQSFTLSVGGQVLGANAGRAGVSGRGADGACAFANDYYCDVANGYSGTIGPFNEDSTRDIYFYVSGNGTSASTGAATVTLTPVN